MFFSYRGGVDSEGRPVMVVVGAHFLLRCLDLERFVLYVVKVCEIESRILKFYDNPMVNEFGIVVLPRQFWVSAGKKCYNAKCISLNSDMISKFPTVKRLGIDLRTWFLNFTTIQR